MANQPRGDERQDVEGAWDGTLPWVRPHQFRVPIQSLQTILRAKGYPEVTELLGLTPDDYALFERLVERWQDELEKLKRDNPDVGL